MRYMIPGIFIVDADSRTAAHEQLAGELGACTSLDVRLPDADSDTRVGETPLEAAYDIASTDLPVVLEEMWTDLDTRAKQLRRQIEPTGTREQWNAIENMLTASRYVYSARAWLLRYVR